MVLRHRARGDLPDCDGATAAEIMRRKRSPTFQKLAAELITG